MLTMAELYVNERMLPLPEQNLPPKSRPAHGWHGSPCESESSAALSISGTSRLRGHHSTLLHSFHKRKRVPFWYGRAPLPSIVLI